MSRRLSGQAEEIVNEIKNIIPETAPQDSFIPNQVVRLTAEDGDVMYGGRILAGKVGDLVGHLGIEKGWGWSLWHFPTGKTIINPNSAMYLIPLSDNLHLTPGGVLDDMTYRRDNPMLSPQATILVLMK